jgi:hypothetical protein
MLRKNDAFKILISELLSFLSLPLVQALNLFQNSRLSSIGKIGKILPSVVYKLQNGFYGFLVRFGNLAVSICTSTC